MKIEGTEDQLLATAGTLCGGETITRDAVAGQLIEQQRTSLDYEQLIKLIDDAAHANRCELGGAHVRTRKVLTLVTALLVVGVIAFGAVRWLGPEGGPIDEGPVSYTHLTLPTNREV